MQLSNLTLTGNLRTLNVDPATSTENWDKILPIFDGQGVKLLKGFADLFFFDFPNGKLLGANVQEDLAISNVLIGMGDGTTTTCSSTYNVTPVKPGTASFTYTTGGTQNTAIDDGAGNITGPDINTASIDYATNAVTFDFAVAPDANTPILENFTRGIAGDDTLVSGFQFVMTTDENPVMDDTPFTTTIPLTVTPANVDWYTREDMEVYKISMAASYTDTNPTAKITAIGIVYQAIMGSASGTSEYDKWILKSSVVGSTDLYGTSGLVLSNKTDITLEMMIGLKK